LVNTDCYDTVFSLLHSVISKFNSFPEPGKIGSEGGNVGYTDGSVQWVKQVMMRPHNATIPAGRIIGYW